MLFGASLWLFLLRDNCANSKKHMAVLKNLKKSHVMSLVNDFCAINVQLSQMGLVASAAVTLHVTSNLSVL